ncbi:MAG TPA: LAGLIDADG family homing endonuclease [Candidatus Nanoarchaeia archaeon]|nr:LAGLIDADG family homing endonuclease [Candidatus Nanoarchaeia archaeon]
MRLDLLKLHSKKDSPKGWIWVRFDSKLLKRHYLRLLRNKSLKEITLELCKKLNAGFSTISKHLIRLKHAEKGFEFPLPLLIVLIDYIHPKMKAKVANSFEEFISKTSYTKQRTKAVFVLTEDLAELIGAHMADGHMRMESNSYKINVCDGRRELVESCAKLVENIFGIKSIIRFSSRDNTWSCWFNNKIIGRYFENIFKIKPGKKFDIAKEPELIKNSNFKIRKAFAKGVISFDGGVKTSGMVAISSMSKDLIEDIYNILKEDGIEVNKRYNKKKKSWLIESISGRNENYLSKLLYYFEKDTWKYNRLKFFINPRKLTIDELNYLFPEHHLSKVSLNEVYCTIKKLKKTNVSGIISELKRKDINVNRVTLFKYFYLLEKSSLIEKQTIKIDNGINYWNENLYGVK